MGVPDKGLVEVGRFPAGIDQVSPITDPPRDDNGNIIAARELVNVDIDNAGRARMRRGQSTVDDAPSHSLFAGQHYLFAWVDGDLRAYRKEGTTIVLDTTLLTGLSDRFLTFADDDYDVYASNGTTECHKRIASDLTVHPFWLDTPAPATVSAASGGGLAAGNYEVSVTAVDADGRESGASDPVLVTLTAGQGISVTLPGAPEDAARWRVYRSTANGGEDDTVLYLAADLPIIATAAQLGEAITEKKIDTAWMQPLPPCTILRYGHGRLVGAALDGLVYSEPFRIGLMLPGNHIGMRGCTLLEPLGEGGGAAGWFTADDRRTYWLSVVEPDPTKWSLRIVHPHAAVPGTSTLLPGSAMGLESDDPIAVWMSTNGTWLLGLPGGQVQPIRENAIALPLNAERGAVAFFKNGGVQQIVATLLGGDANPMNAAMSDTASATVRRHGIDLGDNDINP